MRLPVCSRPIPHSAVRRIPDRFYPSRDRYTDHSFCVSVRAATRHQPENPDTFMVMFCSDRYSRRAPRSGIPLIHVAFRHFQEAEGSVHRKYFTFNTNYRRKHSNILKTPYAPRGHSHVRKAFPAVEEGAEVDLHPEATQVYTVPNIGRGIHLRTGPRRSLYNLPCWQYHRAVCLANVCSPNLIHVE